MSPDDCLDLPHAAPVAPPTVAVTVRERAARMLSAAGEPSRLALLELLDGRELCVSDLVALTGDPMPTISQRLRLLKTEGLLRSRRDGKHVFYTLADAHVRELLTNILHHAAEPLG
ncbi:metalloregulator ArsR/SmtB family transcription factor [Gemmatimonas sp.]|uniref:ArsR/SmtB family transcription factor n=1 Tax=Gemmatimonas sp. TaxID=1962908 RepID=UPI00334073D5